MTGVIQTYAKLVGVGLLALSAAGIVSLGWNVVEIVYHAALGLFFAYAGFRLKDANDARRLVGGLGVLLIAIEAMELLTIWFSPMTLVLCAHDFTGLGVGASSILASRYLPGEDRPRSSAKEKRR